MGRLLFIIAVVMMAAPVCMAEEGEKRDGMFAEGSFFSEAVSSITDKLDKVASGEEKIVSDDARGMGREGTDFDADPLASSRPERDKRF